MNTDLHVQDFGLGYPGAPAFATHWSASIGPGLTLLFGDTGSGKTTLIRALAGIVTEPFDGTLSMAGRSLTGNASAADRTAWSRLVSFCDPWTDAFDQVTMREATARLNEVGDERIEGGGKGSAGVEAGFDEQAWEELIEGFALRPHIDKPLYMLSTGSRRKVWLAAALASHRPLVLLDEPTAALDAPSIRCMWTALAGLRNKAPHRIVILASADKEVGAPLARTFELPLTGA